MKDNEKKFTLPMLEAPRTLRVKFRKVGNLQYISHLDLQRTFNRVLVRAGLPLWYTKGFNPHIKMVFGMPLSVGVESECEFLDIRLEREMSTCEVMERLNSELTEELAVSEVYEAERKFSEIAFAQYDYTITTAGAGEALAERIKEVLSSAELIVKKHTKSGEKEVNIAPLIDSFQVCARQGEILICATLSAGEGSFLSPDTLIAVLRDRLGILSGDPLAERYRILRRCVLLADKETEFR